MTLSRPVLKKIKSHRRRNPLVAHPFNYPASAESGRRNPQRRPSDQTHDHDVTRPAATHCSAPPAFGRAAETRLPTHHHTRLFGTPVAAPSNRHQESPASPCRRSASPRCAAGRAASLVASGRSGTPALQTAAPMSSFENAFSISRRSVAVILSKWFWGPVFPDVPREPVPKVIYPANRGLTKSWRIPSYAKGAASHRDDVSGRCTSRSPTTFHDPWLCFQTRSGLEFTHSG